MASSFAASPPALDGATNSATADSAANRDESYIASLFRRSAHPGAMLFHLLFKLLALASFLLLGLFVKSFIVQTVVTMVLLALDFWTVKNVSGRRLVGLRWWNDVQPDGSNALYFEHRPATADEGASNNGSDEAVFWWTLYLTPVAWLALGIVCVLKFELTWLVLVAVALVLTGTQLVAYWKCSRAARKDARSDVLQSLGVAYVSRQLQGLFRGAGSGGGGSG